MEEKSPVVPVIARLFPPSLILFQIPFFLALSVTHRATHNCPTPRRHLPDLLTPLAQYRVCDQLDKC